MDIVMDMKKLSEDIISSYDMRVKTISDLVSTTHRMMRDIRADHQKMIDNLGGSLDKWETERAKDYKAMMGDIRKAVKEIPTRPGEIQKEVHELLQEFHNRSKEMSLTWRKLSETMAKRRQKGLQQGNLKK
jgi:hypothetical protein